MDQLVETLRAVVGRESVLADHDELLVYECDGLPQHKHLPRAVVFPASTEETSEVMQVLGRAGVPFTPRGAGTGLSGGALALERGVVVELARLRKILHVDEANRFAVVQTGVVNAHVSRAVAPLKLHYVPDPSSQPTCTIGGNIGENAGGVHCLKYGTTTDHVLAIRVVLAGGEIVDLGGPVNETPGFDLRGLFIGSEGTFGIATEATLRLVPVPPAVRTLLAEFPEVNDASHSVSAIIAAGFVPAGLEMMDREIIRAVEASVFAAGLPPDAGAALLIELDGLVAGIDDEAERIKQICLQYGARSCRLARDENERKKLWAARKGAFGAIGRIAPDSMIQDAVVPRSRLPEIMADAYQIASKHRLRIANVFHAGDGNLHPLICFDSRSADEVRRVKEAGRELMAVCVRAGGSITGEHGVGLDKRELLSLIFSDDDLDTMLRVRAAFDPTGLINPGKIIPLLSGCGEGRAVAGNNREAMTLPADETAQERTSEKTRRPLTGPVPSKPLSDHPETIAKLLGTIVGDVNVTFKPSASGSTIPQVGDPIVTAIPIAHPESIAEASEVLKLASRERWAVAPEGAGTWFDVGNPLKRLNLILGTRRLNSITEHEPADLVAVCEAGVRFTEFNRVLMEKGQWLPVDPPGYKESTVGGIVATGISGPQRCGYGPVRGFVIGLQVLLADGRLIKAGGRVVKNVAGYDLCKVFTGSYGTLGLIVRANFKLRPRPDFEASIVAAGSIDSLFEVTQTMLKEPLFPVAIELVSHSPVGLETSSGPLLLVRFAGNEKLVRAQAEQTLKLLGDKHQETFLFDEDAAIWERLAEAATTTKAASWRANLPPTKVSSFIHLLSQEFAGDFNALRWQAGVADGRIQVTENHLSDESRVQLLQRMRQECQALGGFLVIENASWPLKLQLDWWGDLGKSTTIMRRIKQQLDSEEILSPGRFRF